MSAGRKLLERQARVYEVADIATKPAQWLIGGVKFVFLLLIFAGVCVVGPIYAVMHGGSFSSFQFAIGCWIVGFVIMLFGVPWYTVIWGVAIYGTLFFWNINANESSGNLFIAVLWVYECVGLLLVALKISHWFSTRQERREASQTVCVPDSVGLECQPQLPPPQHALIAPAETTLDSPVPEDLRAKLVASLQSIADEGELLISLNRRQSAIDAMPLTNAMKATNTLLGEMRDGVQVLSKQMATGEFSTPEEASAAIYRFLTMQKTAEEALSSMITRLKRESAPYPITEMEEVLAGLRATTAQAERTAAAKGLL